MKTVAAAVLALFLTACAIVVAERAWNLSGRITEIFFYVKLAGAPAALYFAAVAREWMELRADDRTAWGVLVAEAHRVGLGLAGLGLLIVLCWNWWILGPAIVDILPKALAAAAAGGIGLAWGAIWRLPAREERA